MLMEEIRVCVDPVVHKSILKVYMCWFVPLHQVACYMHLGNSGYFLNKGYA